MYDWDVTLTVISPWPHAMWPIVRELYQFHPTITITTSDLHLQTWNTDKEWKHNA